jgi:hypothetical protein
MISCSRPPHGFWFLAQFVFVISAYIRFALADFFFPLQDRRLGHGSSQQSQGMSQCVVPPISSVYWGCEAESMRMLRSCCAVLRLGLELLDFMCYYSVWQCALPPKNTRASPSWAQKCLNLETEVLSRRLSCCRLYLDLSLVPNSCPSGITTAQVLAKRQEKTAKWFYSKDLSPFLLSLFAFLAII